MELEKKIAAARSVNNVPFSELDTPFTSLGELLVARASDAPDHEFLAYYDHNGMRTSWSWSSFAEGVNKTARFLLRSGVGRGSRVGVLGHNHEETVIQYFAAWLIGATVVPLNAGEDDDRLLYILSNSDSTFLFLRESYQERWERLQNKLPGVVTVLSCVDDPADVPVGAAPHDSMRSILKAPAQEGLLPRLHLLDHEALIVYTSGTTGDPKGVVLTHGNLLADAQGIADWHGIEPGTTMMCVLPIHHVNGTVVTLITPFLAGARVVLNRKFQTSTFFERIAQERVHIVSVVPTLLAYLCSSERDIGELDLSHFRHLICGAGPLTCELAIRFQEQYSMKIVHGYGLSETTCYSCFLPTELPDEEHRAWLADHRFPSIGVPLPQNEMAIHDVSGREVAPGERGEIVIRGHNVMQGYFNNPDANASTFQHSWFRSGDEGFSLPDRDGRLFYFITGRLKELIIRGGVNLSPLEIDEILNAHPGIDAAIAVGFENSWYGEEIGAVVRRRDPKLSEDDVIDWTAERLPFSKRPKVVVFTDDIPVTSTGKYQRNRVKHYFTRHKETQFRENG